MTRRLDALALAALLAAMLGACERASPSAPLTEEGLEDEVLVFAATSLRDAFATLERDFEAAHPGLDVTLQLAGTQELRAQIEAGAPADVIASADRASMDALLGAHEVASYEIFCRNEPVVVVSREARGRVTTFEALGRAERVVLGAVEVPIGRYSASILEGAEAELGAGFRATVEARVISREPNVRQVLARVALGEADAGIVYRTDALTAPEVTVLEIPERINVVAEYPQAALVRAPHPRAAAAWVAFVRGARGQEVLADAGFLPGRAP